MRLLFALILTILCYGTALTNTDSLQAILLELKAELSTEDAIAAYQELEKEYAKDSSSIGLINHDLAKLYGRNKDFVTALNLTQKAVNYRIGGVEEDYRKSLFNLGYYYIKLDEYAKAVIPLKEIIDQNIIDDRHLKSLNELGRIYLKIGDYDLAYNYFVELGSNIHKTDDFSIKRNYWIERANCSYHLGKVSEISLLEESLSSFEFQDGGGDVFVFKTGDAFFSLALLYELKEDWNKAIWLYGHGYKTYKHFDFSYEQGQALINMGNCYNELEDYTNALLFQEKAKTLIEDTPALARIEDNISEIYAKQGKYKLALQYSEQALAIFNTIHCNPNNLKSLGGAAINDYLTFTTNKAKYALALYKQENGKKYLDIATTEYETADKIIDHIKQNHKAASSKLFWSEKVKPIYNNAVEAAYLSDNVALAFRYIEKSKAIILLDEMLDNLSIQNKVPRALLDEELSLKQQITGLEIDAFNSDDNQDKLALRITEKQVALDQLLIKIAEFNPEYIKTKYRSQFKSLQDIQAHLANDETLINYLFTGEHFYKLTITETKSHLDRIESKENNNLQAFALACTQPIQNKSSLAAFNQQSKQWYQKLIPDTVTENLILLPDGLLNYIPMEVLLNKDEKPLLAEHSVSYGYSANTYFAERKTASGRNNLAFAPISYGYEGLSSLNFSKNEIKALSGKRLVGENATKSALIDALPNKRIIHITSHGSTGDTSQAYSWLAAQDQKLYLPELYNIKTNANLVVLSACETSLGKEIKGEGVLSLARGFFHSGSNSVLSSLWQVNEESTAIIMQRFYYHLKKGNPKGKALQLAKKDFFEQYPVEAQSPYYWAGLVYYGQNEELKMGGGMKSLWLTALLGAILLFGLFVWRGKRKLLN